MEGSKLNERNFNLNIKKALILLFLSALSLRLIIMIGYVNIHDTYWYRAWALGLQNGFFDIYTKKEISLDYPPLYLICLYIIGIFYKFLGNTNADVYVQMFLMKFWPVLFDLLLGLAIYFFAERINKKTALLAAALWLFNPAGIFNCAFWGQTDSLMCLMLLLSFWALEKRPVAASVMFALAGLTKFQCLYFLPVFLFFLFYKYGFKKFLFGIAGAFVTVLIVFLPFMIGCKNPFLFFDVYLSGLNTYPYCTLNAFNIYGLLNLNWVKITETVAGNLTFGLLSNILTVLIVAGVIVLMAVLKKKSAPMFCLLLIELLFMLTVKMHERYQYPVLIFAIMLFAIYNKKEFLNLFIMFSAVITANQAIVMFGWNQSTSVFGGEGYAYFMSIISLLNIALMIYTLFVAVRFFKESEEECLLAQGKEIY